MAIRSRKLRPSRSRFQIDNNAPKDCRDVLKVLLLGPIKNAAQFLFRERPET